MYNSDVNGMQYTEAYRQASHRVKAKMGFYGHLASYVIVNGMLIGIYILTAIAAGHFYYPWFVWPMLGWGIGLAFHFLGTFVFSAADSPANRQRMIEEEMRRMGVSNPIYTSVPTDRK